MAVNVALCFLFFSYDFSFSFLYLNYFPAYLCFPLFQLKYGKKKEPHEPLKPVTVLRTVRSNHDLSSSMFFFFLKRSTEFEKSSSMLFFT